jgi:hypothetical protein
MSLLGGFNYIFQMRRDKLLGLIRENVTVQGNALEAPFRLILAGASSGSLTKRTNTVDMLVKSVDLALDIGTNFCHLKLGLEGGVIRLEEAPEVIFPGGEVDIQMELVNGTLLFVRPLGATFTAPASPVLAGVTDFAARANAEVNKLINDERNKDFQLFHDAPTLMTVPLLIGGINRNLNADTVCACAGSGNVEDVTPSVDGKNSIALAFAANIIKQSLPGIDQLSRSPVTATRVDYTFRDGYIDVDGEFDAEDDCWSIDGGTFSQRVYLTFASGNIVPKLVPPTPNLSYHLHLEWYCVLAAEVLSVIQMLLVPIIATAFKATWIDFILKMLDGGAPASGAPNYATTEFGDIVWNDVKVSPEGLIWLGDRIGVVPQARQPAVHIRTKNEPQNRQAVGAGPVTVQAPRCAPEVFEYVQLVQDDRYTLTVDSEWLLEPIKYVWTVNGQALASLEEGVQQYMGTVNTALPPPEGTAIPGHAIELQYALGIHIPLFPARGTDRTLTLNARKGDLNYSIHVEMQATDALGRAFTDSVNLKMVGDIAKFGRDYDEYLIRCLKASMHQEKLGIRKIKPGEPVEQLADLLAVVSQQFREGDRAAAELIPSLMKTFGVEAVSRALAGTVEG